MKNLPLTLSTVFDLGIACMDDIYKDDPEKAREAKLDFALNYLSSLNKPRRFIPFIF